MDYLGKLLLFLGTVVGALGGAHLPEANWTVSGVGFGLLALGAVLIRVVEHQRQGHGRNKGNFESVRAALEALPPMLEGLASEAKSLSLQDLVARLTELEGQQLRPISNTAPTLLGVLGGSTFADVFGPYASGERYLARAWSAAADGHRAEAIASLAAGIRSLKRAAQAASDAGRSLGQAGAQAPG